MLTKRVRNLTTNIVSEKELTKYSQIPYSQAFELFLPNTYNYVLVQPSEKADICIVGIGHTDDSELRKDEINILLCVENLKVGRTHYKFFNKFGRFGNSLIDCFLYNDITYPEENSFPIVYLQIQHFLRKQSVMTIPSVIQNKKRFCLFTSRNLLNKNKTIAIQKLSTLGRVDHIANYNLENCSCYQSRPLLELYSQYKFIICFENSKTDGYTTEKIFNVFLSGSVPIYDGPNNVGEYFNRDAFISYDNNGVFVDTLKGMMDNEMKYTAMIRTNKINEGYINKIASHTPGGDYLSKILLEKK